jgi:hypothetical protein
MDAAERGNYPDSSTWDTFVELIRHVYESGELPTELTWSVLVLTPKVSDVFRGTGILEVAWKIISAIIDTRINFVIEFHDSLHGFRPKRGTGTATIEARLQMQLSHVRQQTNYQIFIDMVKA